MVWVSLDNVTYSQVAKIEQPARQGFLTASLAAASGWDTTHTLSVNLAESGGALTGTTATATQQGVTLSLVDSELLAYESATLAGAYAYNLTGLQRSMYGTAGALHSSGAPFTRLDGSIVQYAYPSAYIGKTIFLKFQSFNIFGAGVQDLSTCTAYSHTLIGIGSGSSSILSQLSSGLPLDLGLVTQTPPTIDGDFGQLVGAVLDAIDLGGTP